MTASQPPRSAKFGLIHGIMIALLVWGGYLALGALQAPGNLAAWRSLIIFGCTVAFLAFWLVALAVRRRS